MKKSILALLLGIFLLFTGCAAEPQPLEDPTTIPTTTETQPPTTLPEPIPTETATEPPVPVLELTDEEKEQLLKIGMAELGDTECTECIALVMCTVLNRVEAKGFGSTIYGVIHAQDQFTPVSDGSFDRAVPNATCYEALDMVICGWDESQGALYYEFCEGESWHSKNLELLFQHCNTRFYK